MRQFLFLLIVFPSVAFAASSFEELQQLANQGDAKAENSLALAYIQRKDGQSAHEWFEKAADQGQPDGLFNLGVMYARGRYVAQDQPKAAGYFLKAAEAGHLRGQYVAGLLYHQGLWGVTKDEAKSQAWFTRAAEHGYPDAQMRLAAIYHQQGDAAKTQLWLDKAAAGGNTTAQKIKRSMASDEAVGEAANTTSGNDLTTPFKLPAGYKPADSSSANRYTETIITQKTSEKYRLREDLYRSVLLIAGPVFEGSNQRAYGNKF